jgi:hypothetical protein
MVRQVHFLGGQGATVRASFVVVVHVVVVHVVVVHVVVVHVVVYHVVVSIT